MIMEYKKWGLNKMARSKKNKRPRRKSLNLDTFILGVEKFYYEHTLMGMAQ